MWISHTEASQTGFGPRVVLTLFKQRGSPWPTPVRPENKYLMRVVETYMRTDEDRKREREREKRGLKRRKAKSPSLCLVFHLLFSTHDGDGELEAEQLGRSHHRVSPSRRFSVAVSSSSSHLSILADCSLLRPSSSVPFFSSSPLKLSIHISPL